MDRPDRDGPKDRKDLDFAPQFAQNDALTRRSGAASEKGASESDLDSGSGSAEVVQNNGLNSVDILRGQTARGPSPLRLPQAIHIKAVPIGTAEMLSDESIKLHLHAESTDRKTHGDGEMIVHPHESNYQAIRQHIGEITRGEIKFVLPWLDEAGRITNDTPVKNDLLPPLTGPDTTGGDQRKGDGGTTDPGKTDPGKTDQEKIDKDKTDPGKTGPQNGAGSGVGAGAGANATAPAADIIVPPSPAFDAAVNKTYNAMSAETREIIRQSGARVKAVHHLTDAMPELKGQAPRGWPAGATWDAVDGCYSGGKKEIIVAEERQALSSSKWIASGRTEQVLRHETGHAIDATIKTLSEHDDFKKAYDLDVQAMQAKDKPPLDYFLQPGTAGREETVAESVADREGGATGGQTFHNDFANAIKVVNDTINAVGRTSGTPPITSLVPNQPQAGGDGSGSGMDQPTANTAGGNSQPR
jgi:hypothetical protein